MDYISENLMTPVRRRADVVVAGGGIAGCAAALAAKRAGAEKVLLLEKQYMLGGLAVPGLVAIYLPLCDGMGRQVSFGISEELLRLSILHGDEGRRPDAWLNGGSFDEKKQKRFEVQFNPSVFSMLLEKHLSEEGVEILYGVYAAAVQMRGKNIETLIIEGKSGREAIEAKNFIDATGDADIFRYAGAKTELFRQGNILAGWYYFLSHGQVRLKMLGAADIPEEYKKDKDVKPQRRYAGVDTDEITEFMLDSHKATLSDFISGGGLTPERSLTSVASIPQLRMTRKICGVSVLDDKSPYRDTEDSIGLVADWRKRGAAFSVPYSSLYGADIDNLAAAGRCISVTDSMWDITRVIPACAVTGEAAGTAAAMFSDFASADVSALQKKLVSSGVKISFEGII